MTATDNDLATQIATIEQQEQRLQFTRFDNTDAWALGSRFVELATERSLPIVVDIRRSGQQLFHVALPGTFVVNDSWVERKIRVVERFGESSFLVGRRFAAHGDPLDESMGMHPIDYAAHGGAFPIRIKDVGVVGSVTVSGLPEADDHALAVEVIEWFIQTERY